MSVSKDTMLEALRIFKSEMQNDIFSAIVEALDVAGGSSATVPSSGEWIATDEDIDEMLDDVFKD